MDDHPQLPARGQRNVIWGAYDCAETNNHVIVGKANYHLVGIDGKLLPTRKDQPPPDLRYFKPAPK